MNLLERVSRVLEFAIAGFLTLAVGALHFNVMQHAGPLWRDEISSLRVATMPTWSGFWSALVYDPVPALFFAVLRAWSSVSATDESFRLLGFLIGIGILVAIWVAAWSIKKAPPTWAILLFGLSPVALVWGDSMRAYGLGCLWNILAIGFLAKLLCARPRPLHIALAATTALFSVHSLFPNALLLFAAGTAAIVVAVHRRWWRTALIIASIGFGAALSLLPYAGIIRQTQSWSPLAKASIDSNWILTMLFRALQSGGSLAAWLWIGGGAISVLVLLVALIRPRLLHLDEDDRNMIFYTAATLLIALFITVAFFRFVGWATSLWYYLPIMATAVVCIDAVSKLLRKTPAAVLANSLLVLVAAGLMCPLVFQATNVRLTNVDLTTRAIAARAQPEDLIIVDNYFYAISFNRYYHGQAPWLSVPDVSDVTLHRWDLLTETMRRPRPIQPVLDRIDQTLKDGHDVYVVGFALRNHGASVPPDLTPAPAQASGWSLWPYVRRWTVQIAYAVQTHAAHGKVISVQCSQPISSAENINAVVVSGWKDPKVAAVP